MGDCDERERDTHQDVTSNPFLKELSMAKKKKKTNDERNTDRAKEGLAEDRKHAGGRSHNNALSARIKERKKASREEGSSTRGGGGGGGSEEKKLKQNSFTSSALYFRRKNHLSDFIWGAGKKRASIGSTGSSFYDLYGEKSSH